MRKTLGSFLEETSEKTTENDQYPVLTSSKAGLFFQSDYFNKQVASKNNVGYKIIHRGEFTYRAMSDTGKFFPNMLECADIGIVSPAYPVFRISRQGLVEPDYLKYFFRSDNFQYSISRFAQGSTRTSIRFAQMKTVFINLPNLNEQKAVVSVLKEAEKAIKLRQQELDKFDELIKARFVELFGDMILNPNGWEQSSLGKVCDVRDGTHDSPKYYMEGYPLVTSKNVTSGKIDFSDCSLICEDDYEKINQRSKVDYGDILMPMIGTVGNPVIVDVEPKFAIKNVALIKFYEDSSVLNTFVKGLLESDYFDRAVISKVRGGTQKFIALGNIRELQISIPPMNIQLDYQYFVQQVDKSKSVVKKSLDETQLLFDSLMQKYFG